MLIPDGVFWKRSKSLPNLKENYYKRKFLRIAASIMKSFKKQ
jgi:hypothetical protein